MLATIIVVLLLIAVIAGLVLAVRKLGEGKHERPLPLRILRVILILVLGLFVFAGLALGACFIRP